MLQAIRNAIALPEIRTPNLVYDVYPRDLSPGLAYPGAGCQSRSAEAHSGQSVASGSGGGWGALVNLIGLLSGGAVYNFSVLAMGVYPYVTAHADPAAVDPGVPQLEEIAKEGEAGRRKINKLDVLPDRAHGVPQRDRPGQHLRADRPGVAGGARVMPAWGLYPVREYSADPRDRVDHDRRHHVRGLAG